MTMKTYTSTTNRKGAVEFTKRNEFEYVPNRSKAVLFLGMLAVLVIAVLIMGVINVKATNQSEFIGYSSYGCVPYTRGMVTGHYAAAMTHSPCNDSGRVEKNVKSEDTGATIESVVPVSTVAPEIIPVVTDTPSIVTPPTVEPTQAPTIERKTKCNNGEGNGSEGCSPAKSPNANNDENDTTPREDKHTGSLGFAGFIFVTFRIGRGKREYFAHVSSWSMKGKDLWLFIWGENGNCGWIPNGKVTDTCVSSLDHASVSEGTAKVIKAWND
jgi:hypothetical protein